MGILKDHFLVCRNVRPLLCQKIKNPFRVLLGRKTDPICVVLILLHCVPRLDSNKVLDSFNRLYRVNRHMNGFVEREKFNSLDNGFFNRHFLICL